MTSRLANLRVVAHVGAPPAGGVGSRAAWSRPISLRADSKLAPCMARPNLFSGD